MKYIQEDAAGTHFDAYFRYIASIKSRLAPHVFAFASDYSHYDLRSRSSLHDAWLESLSIREAREAGESQEQRHTSIILELLGPYHDRRIKLVYKGVESYSAGSTNTARGLGDLLIHELTLSEEGSLVHEIAFEHGLLSIQCKDFEHTQSVFS